MEEVTGMVAQAVQAAEPLEQMELAVISVEVEAVAVHQAQAA